MDEIPVGPISALGRRYLAGELRQDPLAGSIELSRQGDVPDVAQFSAAETARYRQLARRALARGEVVLGVLAAGASSRMDLKQLPPEVERMLRESGHTDLPHSKALVPVIERDQRPLNYLDLFLINVRRFSEQTGTRPRVLLFVSESNRAEISEHLERVGRQGIDTSHVALFEQPLAPQIVAKEDDARRAEKNFSGADMSRVLEFSRRFAGHDLPRKKPAGHGEFLHQLVASGTLAALHAQGVRYLSVRNIDNVAAVVDHDWLTGLGYLIDNDGEILVEVSARPVGQKGGALIRDKGAWRLAEDPSFHGTGLNATESYYINNAVAILRLDYFDAIYDTNPDELRAVEALPANRRAEQRAEIAQRGRAKFPTIVDAKPLNLDGQIVAALTPETNMWESTAVAAGLRVVPLAVHSDRDAGDELCDLAEDEQQRRAYRVRFCPTKSWDDYADPRKQCIVQHIAERIVAGTLADDSAST